jgi:alkanesulfonate monooxygenase SsuD/methylene tetrahydromethanopterin reductase-like flavin-dependent oxidoreductase (luciferase family)
VEFGLFTFGDLTPDRATGRTISAEQRLQEILAAAKLADEAGFAVFGVGEHHRLDMVVSATPIVLAAIARETRHIRLASAVTILSTSDPVKVFEDFATVDLLSGGRVEIIAGRGIFTESFPLFGFDVADQDALFAENLGLLLQLRAEERVTWKGRFRSALDKAEIPPRPIQRPLPVWIGTGGAPESATRAGALGLPLAMANISLPPAKLAPTIETYRRIGLEAKHDPSELKVSIAGHLYVHKNSQDALDEFYPHYHDYFRTHSAFQYRVREVSRSDFDELTAPHGPVFAGSPQQIVDKIMYERELFGHQRFIAQVDIGGLPYAKVAQAIELLATEVMPKVGAAAAVTAVS